MWSRVNIFTAEFSKDHNGFLPCPSGLSATIIMIFSSFQLAAGGVGATSTANIYADGHENVDDYSGQRQRDQEPNTHKGRCSHARKHSQPQLDHIHHRHQQEQAPHHRRHRREEDSRRQP